MKIPLHLVAVLEILEYEIGLAFPDGEEAYQEAILKKKDSVEKWLRYSRLCGKLND